VAGDVPALASRKRAIVNATVLATLLLGGIAALDATPVAQTLLFQPLVTATLLGWIWQDWSMALSVGIVLQILASSTIPVGVRTPEDYSVGGVIGVGLALGLAAQQPYVLARDGCAFLGVLAGIVTAAGGVPLLKWQRRRNEGLSHWCEAELRLGSEGALAQSHRAAVFLAFAVGFGYCALCWTGGMWALRGLVDRESLRLSRAWSFAEPVWIGLGLAHLLHAFVQRRLARAAAFGAALIAAWLVLMVEAS
jgi:mannose/fructose/N-acetylgalactosamine-specific phosphotransferase system component IIC